MFKNTKEIINTLESAIELFANTNSALGRERAKLMVVASRHALQALALDFAERRFPVQAQGAQDATYKTLQTNGSKESHPKRLPVKAGRIGR